jgi:hypothetical protein
MSSLVLKMSVSLGGYTVIAAHWPRASGAVGRADERDPQRWSSRTRSPPPVAHGGVRFARSLVEPGSTTAFEGGAVAHVFEARG